VGECMRVWGKTFRVQPLNLFRAVQFPIGVLTDATGKEGKVLVAWHPLVIRSEGRSCTFSLSLFPTVICRLVTDQDERPRKPLPVS